MPVRRIFLTGATGYSGQAVLPELLKQGFDVTALVRRPATLPGCRTVVGELDSLERIKGEISSAEAIVHLGSSRSFEQELTLKDDILGTSHLIEAWHTGPFAYASSPTVQNLPERSLTEDWPIDIQNWYDMGKFSSEFQLRLAASSDSRGPAIVLRPGLYFIVNPRVHDRQYLGQIYRMCQAGGKFFFDSEEGLENYGTSFIGGTDFARAIVLSLNIQTTGTYNVASGDFTWRELIENINRCGGTRADFVVRPGGKPEPGEWRLHQSRFYVDSGAFRAHTGFVPQQSLEELIEEFVRGERATAAKPA